MEDISKNAVDTYSLLLTDEERWILKSRNLREKMIDAFIDEKGIPTKTGEMRVVNEILNSNDDQIFKLADQRFKQADSLATEDLTETIKEIFMTIDTGDSVATNKDTNIPDKFIPNDIVPDEDVIEYKEITMDDIIK